MQAVDLISERISKQLYDNVYGVQDANGEDADYIREATLNTSFTHRTRIGDVVVLTSGFGRIMTMESHDDLVQITTQWSGSEEYDGEDAGTKHFVMNASSLKGDFKRRVKAALKVSHEDFLRAIR